jgi:hypothetical protein
MSWTELEIQSVWEKGAVVEKYNSRKWRKDSCGAWISRDQHGNRNSPFGWEIDPALPEVTDDTHDLSELQPLQWKNAAARRNGGPTCPVKAYGGDNIDFG